MYTSSRSINVETGSIEFQEDCTLPTVVKGTNPREVAAIREYVELDSLN